jgi:hypothetical protein
MKMVIVSNDSSPNANEELVSALSKGRNTKPVGQLHREGIYDRASFAERVLKKAKRFFDL